MFAVVGDAPVGVDESPLMGSVCSTCHAIKYVFRVFRLLLTLL